ncbi:Hypothetical predicted protein [Olea europaea subsp. europaea]|uniref:Uncharacterized protein n=1 Tax=Olea europaea subsp. europaea TaxID=158383 RepID=A0A8S0TLF4_OLEEU|nr:Hypothetical predicted protein [Olea europaea subsp. europaea]
MRWLAEERKKKPMSSGSTTYKNQWDKLTCLSKLNPLPPLEKKEDHKASLTSKAFFLSAQMDMRRLQKINREFERKATKAEAKVMEEFIPAEPATLAEEGEPSEELGNEADQAT